MIFTENFRLMVYGPAMINIHSDPIVESDYQHIPKLRRYMLEVMKRTNGVGLAAPQIGVFKCYALVESAGGIIVDLVNPQIKRMYGKELEGYEGCLSLPPAGNECLVPRVDTIHVEASTGNAPSRRREFIFTRLTARIVQHEIDHLTGTFFIDRVSDKSRRIVLERFTYWKKMRKAQERTTQRGSGNVDAGVIAACGGKSRLS